jgi:Iap family predicted aminopeptidase
MGRRKAFKKKRNKHHIKNKVNGGGTQGANLLLIDEEKHQILHKVFGNLDFYEIIVLLIRVCRAKHYETINPKISKFYKIINDENKRDFIKSDCS